MGGYSLPVGQVAFTVTMYESSKIWLVGGGLSEPATYGDLASLVHGHSVQTICGVADVLVKVTGALVRGECLDLGVLELAAEGQAAVNFLVAAHLHGSQTATQRSGLHPDELRSSGGTLVLHTSGSTGVPSAVAHTYASLTRFVVKSARHANNVWGLAFNPSHIGGVQVYLQALANFNTVINLWGVPSAEIMRRCAEHRVTHLSGTPTFYRMLLPHAHPLPALRSLAVGGEAVDAGLLQRIRDNFPGVRIHNIYASTEAGTVLMGNGEELVVPQDMAGRVQVKDGRLWLHASLTSGACASEWFDTGDLVTVTGTKPLRLHVTGRVDGWVNVGGEKVDPVEVEAALAAHPSIAAARVSARKNSVTGNVLTADIVVRDQPPAEATLRAFLMTRLSLHKIPRIIRIVESIERTRTGKIKRL